MFGHAAGSVVSNEGSDIGTGTRENEKNAGNYPFDMDDFATINGIYAKYFEKDCPARSCVEIARLPKDVLLEMEAIAVK